MVRGVCEGVGRVERGVDFGWSGLSRVGYGVFYGGDPGGFFLGELDFLISTN